MKANLIYVLGVDYTGTAETRNVCKGLLAKYTSRCQLIELWSVNSIGGKVEKIEVADGGGEEFKHEVGVYVVMHAAGPHVSEAKLTPKDLVNTALPGVLGNAFPLLGRLVFVSCDLAPDKGTINTILSPGADVGTVDQQPGSARSYILSVLLHLNDKEVRPAVVGWDCYVSALPHVPKKKDETPVTIYTNPTKSSAEKVEVDESHAGKKISQKRHYGLISGDPVFRKEHKRTFRVVKGKVLWDAGEGWSDEYE